MKRPLLIYDNHCKSCSRFASTAQRLSRGWIIIIGHYTYESEKFRNLPNFRDMFWIIIDKQAYGGRNGLLPLFKEIIKGLFNNNRYEYTSIKYKCIDNCSLLTRIKTLFINGRKIKM